MCWGRGSRTRATPCVVHLPQPPPGLQICLPAPVCTGRPRLKFSSCVPYQSWSGAGGDQTSVTAVVQARLLQGVGAGLWTPALDAQSPRGRFGSPGAPRGRAQRAELCAPASQGEAANLQISAQTHRLPSACKVLLIKPVHLITGRSNKYLSRCFRCSLWALVKAAKASDQGCRPHSTGAGSRFAGTLPAPGTAMRPRSFAERRAQAPNVNYQS